MGSEGDWTRWLFSILVLREALLIDDSCAIFCLVFRGFCLLGQYLFAENRRVYRSNDEGVIYIYMREPFAIQLFGLFIKNNNKKMFEYSLPSVDYRIFHFGFYS